jgi:hypothetical protein
MVLNSAGVEVTVSVVGATAQSSPTTIPLVVLATRANKLTPDGTGTALGTIEANRLRQVTSQRELIQNYGTPVFVTSGGDPVQGDETNEYGLLATYSFLGQGNSVFILRSDIDLGQLVPSTTEPSLSPDDGSYWVNSGTLVGGIFKYVSSVWTAVPFHVFQATPSITDGVDGDFGFDYTTDNGTLVFRASGVWYPASDANLVAHGGATNPLTVNASAPVSPAAGDFWFKNTTLAGGTNIQLTKFNAATGTWISQTVIRQPSAPTPTAGVIWEDISTLNTTGFRPLRIGTGSTFVLMTLFVQNFAPTADPALGTYWYDDTLSDFAMYQENNNIWIPITTTTNSNVSGTQKYVSASAPTFPSTGAIWIDVSTEINIDNYPVVKQWSGTQWIDITSTVIITDTPQVASLVANSTIWINTGESLTRNIVKQWDPTYVAHTVNISGAVVVQTGNFWGPQTGTVFGRKSQRQIIVQQLQATITANQDIRSEAVYFQLIASPGYPELYDDMLTLNTDNGDVAFIVADTPKFMIPSGISVGREITAQDWATNVNNVEQTGEQGFSGAPTPYAAFHYPWGLSTNLDGNNVMVPPSHIMLSTFAYSDSISAPWFPPAGYTRGPIQNAGSVGYLSDAGIYTPVVLNRAQRDILQAQKINPFYNSPNRGLTVFGQITMEATSDSLNRINVARLICKMKYDLQRLLEPFLFEINDAITQRSAQVVTSRYLAGLKSLRALYDFACICDSSNNSQTDADNYTLNVAVAIKPSKGIEFIYIPITVYNAADTIPS